MVILVAMFLERNSQILKFNTELPTTRSDRNKNN